MNSYTVTSDLQGWRVDSFLHKILSESVNSSEKGLYNRNVCSKYVHLVRINGKPQKKGVKLKVGDIVELDKNMIISVIQESFSKKDTLKPDYSAELEIVDEGSDWMVINKQKGIVMHPGVGNWDGTLANRVKGYLLENDEWNDGLERAGIVHRLDKGVSGLVIIAKTPERQHFLKKQFESHTVLKIYRATVNSFDGRGISKNSIPIYEDSIGSIIEEIKSGKYDFEKKWYKITGNISRDLNSKVKMVFKPLNRKSVEGKYSVTYIRLFNNGECLVKIETGRTHQIRATLKYLGLYITGDTLYGPKRNGNLPDSIELECTVLGLEIEKGKYVAWSL